jgi:hypothetical protein
MSAPAEQRETLQAEILVAMRRLGYDRAHFALVMPATVTAGAHFGAPCQFIAAPVVAFCGATLRGRLVVISGEYLDGWQRQNKVCLGCKFVARAALAQHRAEPPS